MREYSWHACERVMHMHERSRVSVSGRCACK